MGQVIAGLVLVVVVLLLVGLPVVWAAQSIHRYRVLAAMEFEAAHAWDMDRAFGPLGLNCYREQAEHLDRHIRTARDSTYGRRR